MSRVRVVVEALGLEIRRLRGTRAWCYCPFHESTSTSAFFVRLAGERAGTYHCFRCKAGGSLIDLVMHVRGVEREDARAFVRSAGKAFVPERRRARVVAREPELARRRFAMPRLVVEGEPVESWPEEFRSYLAERGIGGDAARAFALAYAVDGPLAGRVVIPFLDERAQLRTYSARSVVGDVPKYRTPDEREGPDVEAVFGAHLWPPDRRRLPVVANEGAIDAMSVWMAAPEGTCVAALNGSEVQPGQLLALASFGGVVIATDADAAGDRAAQAIRYALGRHVPCSRLRLPEDANALWAAGGEKRRSLRRAIRVALREVGAP